jgi:TonB family protein
VEVPPRPINLAAFRRQLERTYPPHLRDGRIQAPVHVRMLVDTAGVPHEIEIVRTTHKEFSQPTLESIGTLRFRPARVDGKPVNVWVELPIEWSVSAPPRTDPFEARGGQGRP